MAQLIRDSFFGRFLRYASRGKWLPFEEEKNPLLLKQFSIKTLPEKSSQLANNETKAEEGDDIQLVGWYCPDDSENPLNWANSTKIAVTFQLCFLTFAVYVGSSIYTAGIVGVMKEFKIGMVVALTGLTVFVLGCGLGPMTLAPLSEVPSIGRNSVYIFSLALFVILQIPTALSTHIGMLIIFRFITGVLGSPVLATGGASIAEMYPPQKRALAIGIWGLAALGGPVLGPPIGGFAAQAYGWRWTLWALMIIAGFALIMLVLFLPETSSKNILYRRAQRLRKMTNNDKLKTQAEIAFQHVTVGKIAQITVIQPWILTFQEPLVFLLHMWVALIFGLLFIWFESFPLVFEGIYGFNLGQTGLAFMGLLVGALCAVPPFVWYDRAFQQKQFNEHGQIIKPEMRLPPAMVGAFCLPICLFWFGWSTRPDIHWIMPLVGTGFFSIGALLVLNAVLTYLPDAYPSEMASVMAGNAFIRFSSGAACPLFAPAMYHNLGIEWASSLLAFLGVLFVPIPFAFYIYGEKLRQMSKRARKH
ncbi:uncharacterized protein Z518_03554 [Rhinocladiella mackenziei CBS 650.93]|uniref:Major facilitator superfamily (MFS) profile domain-containing protein n=1 Tax=Rhinocladiella mackenziei CBS 650.93 TaxID=1442369 RepID=A0A0D2G2X2_9EURO|nr:uncharacterized protein Z518_03554 [Rhinocladiella mackenziei CBS 650.93]KIX08897.1 hypothetical protein Z518_03554 [Rhinocladiella mackenziei CBS 650.93]